MKTAIIGIGNLGASVARHLVHGGESVVLAARDERKAQALADELGPLASAASVADAIEGADTVIFAVWLDTTRELLARSASLLEDKVVIDPSNPIGIENGQMIRTLPDGQSASDIVAGLLPASAHYVKGFGSLAATDLASHDNREQRVVLFYATDDDSAGRTIERLIRATGFDPLKVGGVADAWRIEAPSGDLQGAVLDLAQARVALAAKETSA